jgi:hypothetical protein
MHAVPDWNQLVPLLGVATPLVIILLQLLNKAEKREDRAAAERKEITDKFLLAQKEFADGNRDMLKEMMTALHANTAAIHEMSQNSKADHAALLAAIDRLVTREAKGQES